MGQHMICTHDTKLLVLKVFIIVLETRGKDVRLEVLGWHNLGYGILDFNTAVWLSTFRRNRVEMKTGEKCSIETLATIH
jgi:hypothetical protein